MRISLLILLNNLLNVVEQKEVQANSAGCSADRPKKYARQVVESDENVARFLKAAI